MKITILSFSDHQLHSGWVSQIKILVCSKPRKPQLVYLQIFRPIFSSPDHCSCEKSQQWFRPVRPSDQLCQTTSLVLRPSESKPPPHHCQTNPSNYLEISFLSVVHHMIMTFLQFLHDTTFARNVKLDYDLH